MKHIKVFRHRAKGFTLLEVLAALGVVAFTVPALMTLMMKQADNSGALRNKAIANWIAENTLVKLRLDRQLGGASLRRTQDEKVEMAGTQWIVVTEPEETASGALLRYRTTVSLQEGQPLSTLDTFIH